MSVANVRPVFISLKIDGEGYKNYTCKWEETVTDAYEHPLTISTAAPIPLYGEQLLFGTISDDECFCNGKDIEPIHVGDSNLQRTVVSTFTNRPSNGRSRSGNAIISNPLYEPWKVSGSYATGTKVTSRDKGGFPIMTSGLEVKYFDIPDGYDTLNLEGPSLTMSLPQRAQAVLRCNSATIWDLLARQVFLSQWLYEELYYGVYQYFYHRLTFWIKYEKWNEKWLNQGTQEYVSANPVGKRIVPILATNDASGKQTKFLDAGGLILPETSIPGSVVTNESEIIPEFDFTALTASIGMPNPLPGNFV